MCRCVSLCARDLASSAGRKVPLQQSSVLPDNTAQHTCHQSRHWSKEGGHFSHMVQSTRYKQCKEALTFSICKKANDFVLLIFVYRPLSVSHAVLSESQVCVSPCSEWKTQTDCKVLNQSLRCFHSMVICSTSWCGDCPASYAHRTCSELTHLPQSTDEEQTLQLH